MEAPPLSGGTHTPTARLPIPGFAYVSPYSKLRGWLPMSYCTGIRRVETCSSNSVSKGSQGNGLDVGVGSLWLCLVAL